MIKIAYQNDYEYKIGNYRSTEKVLISRQENRCNRGEYGLYFLCEETSTDWN